MSGTGESKKQLYILGAIGAFLFLSLACAAGMLVYSGNRIANDWREEAARQGEFAAAAQAQYAAQSQAVSELRNQMISQREADSSLAAELRNELATQRNMIESLKNLAATRTPANVVTADPNVTRRPRVVRPRIADPELPVAQPLQPVLKGRAWGPEQATGEPDTFQAGDMQTAWASRTQDDQPEWLMLDYEKAVNITKVKVYETYNPGALVRVTVFDEKTGKEIEVWQGKDPTPMGAGMGVSEIALAEPRNSKRVKIYLDSPHVPGWNEIDAVGIVDDAGKVQWAANATASSTFAEQDGPVVPVRPPIEGKQEF
ncbi:MAG TPA: hypothetical protein VKX17_20040 [Planctomycetota bacterium]|nr:hypothetical protein [Planctomycetota bacterium]